MSKTEWFLVALAWSVVMIMVGFYWRGIADTRYWLEERGKVFNAGQAASWAAAVRALQTEMSKVYSQQHPIRGRHAQLTGEIPRIKAEINQ